MGIEELKKAIENKKKFESDNPNVEIARIKSDAATKLADSDNDNFSELTKDSLQDETFDYALAISFASNPLKNLEDRLKSMDIKDKNGKDIRLEIITLKGFLKEFLIRRHCLNRKRVDEYIDALNAVEPRNQLLPQDKSSNLMNRLV